MTIEELKTLIWRYFIIYWNDRRICSANGGLPPMLKRSGLGNSLSPNFRSFFMFFFFAFLHIPENIFVKFSKKY